MNSFLKGVVSSVTATAVIVASAPSFSNNFCSKAENVPNGFVYTKGTQFMCDQKPYYFAGTNCYYVTFKESQAVDTIFENMKDMGLNVLRIWGNIDAGTAVDNFDPKNPEFQNNTDGIGAKDGVYFQYFDKELGKPVVNEGENGLAKLDYVIKQAEENDIKLIITFTNYWEAFGGIDQYCQWLKEIDGKDHKRNEFYTNRTMQNWYKEYIKTLLNHENIYTGEKLMDSPAVFAWELCNEPRVDERYGSPDVDMTTDKGCNKNIIYDWAKDISEYVKGIDQNHMVCIGDEGFFNFDKTAETAKQYGYDSTFAFTGDLGIDFEKLMSIDTIDFGTPHLCADEWDMTYLPTMQGEFEGTDNGKDDDVDWIKLHSQFANSANKPIIMEEFGVSYKNSKISGLTETNKTPRDEFYKKWLDMMDGSSFNGEYAYAGYNFWMLAGKNTENGYYGDYDGYTIYGDAETDFAVNGNSQVRNLIIQSAKNMNEKNIGNTVSSDSFNFDKTNPQDIVVGLNMKTGTVRSVIMDGRILDENACLIESDKITFKASYLKNLSLGDYEVTVIATEGNSPKFNISLDDSTVKSAEVDRTNLTVDRSFKRCQDIDINLNLNGNELWGVIYDSKYLEKNVDYTVTEADGKATVIIKKSFLNRLKNGENQIILDFSPAKDIIISLDVIDTSSEDEFDYFRNYQNTSDLESAYTVNGNGGDFAMSLADMGGIPAAQITYDTKVKGYAGATKTFEKTDFSDYGGVSLQIKGDGRQQYIVVQLISDGTTFEAYLDLTGTVNSSYNYATGGDERFLFDGSSFSKNGHIQIDTTACQTVYIPFDKFFDKYAFISSSGEEKKVNPANITEYSIYAGDRLNEIGTFKVGCICASNEPVDPIYNLGGVKSVDKISDCTNFLPIARPNDPDREMSTKKFSANLKVLNGKPTYKKGDKITVNVDIETEDFTAFQWKIQYDKSQFKLVSENHNILDDWLEEVSMKAQHISISQNGISSVVLLNQEKNCIPFKGTVATYEFEVIAPDEQDKEYRLELDDEVTYAADIDELEIKVDKLPVIVTVKNEGNANRPERGDVDGDGFITSADALMVLRSVVGLIELDDEQFYQANISKPEEPIIDTTDALVILKYVVGLVE